MTRSMVVNWQPLEGWPPKDNAHNGRWSADRRPRRPGGQVHDGKNRVQEIGSGTVPRPPFPTSLREFQRQFAEEAACRAYLEACRWPEGFRCLRCGGARAYPLREWPRSECAQCRYQVSLTAGTVFHRTRTPLTTWFWPAYLMTTDKRGISALLLQRQLGIRRYETAWVILHKLRRAMVNVGREPLHGDVEIDDTWLAAHSRGCGGVGN